ncbi:MAG: DUF2802 domain-containing protein [Gammaproteobacteria bacterium]|nr:MAG: DUF2802 domain-containing protein [Gammaproteobacteria bacterium]
MVLIQRRRHAALERALASVSQQLAELVQQQTLAQQSINGLTAGAVGVDRRLRRVEATEKLLSERQETIENQQAAEQPYSHAIRLVQQGATARRLVEELSLSESEADLLVRLHGLRDSA